jgi:hypothetical protein
MGRESAPGFIGAVLTVLVSALVSVFVSAVVALGVEWAAKPRLEARKERLLTIQRARWQMWRCLNQILKHGTALAVTPPSGPDEDTQSAHYAVVPVVRDLEAAFDEATSFDGKVRLDTVGIIASYVGNVRGVMASDCAWQDKGQELKNWTTMLMDGLGGPTQPPWYSLRRRYRARRLAELRQALE